MQDIKYFRQARHKTDQQYPFERASKFTKAIRQLGVNSKGQSCLDQFRELITQIGEIVHTFKKRSRAGQEANRQTLRPTDCYVRS